MNLKSGVWAHFIRNPVSQTVECKLCKAKFKSTGDLNAPLVQQVYYARTFAIVFVTTRWTDYLCFIRTFCRGRKSSSQCNADDK